MISKDSQFTNNVRTVPASEKYQREAYNDASDMLTRDTKSGREANMVAARTDFVNKGERESTGWAPIVRIRSGK